MPLAPATSFFLNGWDVATADIVMTATGAGAVANKGTGTALMEMGASGTGLHIGIGTGTAAMEMGATASGTRIGLGTGTAAMAFTVTGEGRPLAIVSVSSRLRSRASADLEARVIAVQGRAPNVRQVDRTTIRQPKKVRLKT